MIEQNDPTARVQFSSLPEIETNLRQFTDRADSMIESAVDAMLQGAALPTVEKSKIAEVTDIIIAAIPVLIKSCWIDSDLVVTGQILDIGEKIAHTVPGLFPHGVPNSQITREELVLVSNWVGENIGKGQQLTGYPELIRLGLNPLTLEPLS